MDALLATVIAIVLSLMGVSTFVYYARLGTDAIVNAATASQLAIFNKAAQQYVSDNGAIIAGQASATTPVTVTAAMLSTAGYLPLGYLPTNPYGQTWQLQVLQPTAGQLQSLVTSQGTSTIPSTALVLIAAQSGAQGGFIPYANQGADKTMTPANAYGALGAWKVSMTGYTNPGSGHLASLLAFGSTQTNNSYLYRVPVPTRPELNAMQTDLGMSGVDGTKHSVNGADVVNANEFRLANGAGMKGDQGGSIELGDMDGTHPGQVPYVDFHYGGKGAQDFNMRLMNDSDNHLMVSGANGKGSFGVQGTLQAGNVAAAGTSCAPNGIIAANSDGSGQPMACQYGTWLPIGGRWLRYGYYQVYDAWGVPAPTCPNGGIPRIQVTPVNFTVNNTTAVNYSPATWTGNGWTVHLTDGNGYGIPGAQGVAATYCAY